MRRLALALALTIAAVPASAATWSTSPIDPQLGWTVSLLVDQAAHAHTAYWSPSGGFKYAFYDGTAWDVDTLPPPTTLAENESSSARLAMPDAAQLIFVGRTSLALTPETPWVAYMKVVTSHQEDGPLKVGHKVGATWVTEDIDAHCTSNVHIAASEAGIIYLTYRAITPEYRFMIRNGTWTGEPLDMQVAGLQLDRNGTPWIIYWGGGVGIARRDGPGVWTQFPVDNSVVGSNGVSLQFDSQNRPVVAYDTQTPGTSVYRLIHARWTGTDWVHTWVAPAGDNVICESLVLDAADEPWIAYRDFSNYDVRVARRSGGVWNTDLVDTPTGNYVSMTLDPSGRHWMAYNRNSEGLRMAQTVSAVGVGDARPDISALRLSLGGANPLRAGADARLRIESPAAGTVRVEAFDLSGRRIGGSRSWSVGAGVTSLQWTAPAAHGLLLVRATIDGRSAIARVMVVR